MKRSTWISSYLIFNTVSSIMTFVSHMLCHVPYKLCPISSLCAFATTVNSAYNGSAYKELSVIRNWFLFPDLYPSLFYVKKYGYSGFGYKELSLRRNSFSCPNAYKSSKFRSLSRNPLLVKFAPRHLITR